VLEPADAEEVKAVQVLGKIGVVQAADGSWGTTADGPLSPGR
jgi:hypothetical protein